MARTSLAVTRPADRRAEILEAAGRLFAERGFHVTSTRDICVAVGMSAGNLYHWFPSKQAIIAELLRVPEPAGHHGIGLHQARSEPAGCGDCLA